MTAVDFVVLGGYVAAVLVLSAVYSRRAGRDTEQFILGGRSLPWWIAGTSIIAGQYGADSPLHQSRKIRQTGLGGAWFYWSQIPSQLINALVFARLWRRTGLVTPLEFYDLRYGGRARHVCRVLAVAYTALVEQPALAALGLIALAKVVPVMFDLPPAVEILGSQVSTAVLIVIVALLVQLVYSAASGVWGVVSTELVEFVIAMTASYVLMFAVLREVGGGAGLADRLADLGRGEAMSGVPTIGLALFVYLLVQPFVHSVGLTAATQRFLAIRNESEAMLSGVWRVANHFVLRTWPWYVVGLAAIVLLPGVPLDSEDAYPLMVRTYMPAGFVGLMLAAFFAGAIGQSSHTSAAVIVNDWYRPYVQPRQSERHYVWVSRLAVLAVSGLTAVIAVSASGLLALLMTLMKMQAALGSVLFLRWFWWRVNVWAELVALAVALPITLLVEHDVTVAASLGWSRGPTDWLLDATGSAGLDDRYAAQYLLTTGLTLACWLVGMLVTRPEPDAVLDRFYRVARPYGGWQAVARRCPDAPCTDSVRTDATRVALALVACAGLAIGLWALVIWRPLRAAALLGLAAAAATLLVRHITRATPQSPAAVVPVP